MRIIAKLGAIAALGLGLAFTSQVVAGADTSSVDAATISVTPATGLSDGAAVAVSGTGLQAGAVYHLGECVQVSATSLACDPATNIDVTANTAGAASSPLVVHRAFNGEAHDGTVHTADCSVDNCVVAFFSDTFDGGLVPISFK